ncbi:MAG TPA: CRTAC1 family protein, partial [Bryobacteraceae bacterium]|nr:CRTAC1 family protein [Bryobacteraceae bacterium]
MASFTRRAALTLLSSPLLAQQPASQGNGMASRSVRPTRRSKPSGLPFHSKFKDVGVEAGLTHPVIAGHAERCDYIIEAMSCGVAFID